MPPRRIRKQPLLSKIKSLPFDTFLQLNEARLSIDWDQYSFTIALPSGALLLVLSLFIKPIINYYASISSKSSNIMFDSGYYEYEHLKNAFINNKNTKHFSPQNMGKVHVTTTLVWFLNFVRSAILVVCLINSYNIVTRVKTYGLLYARSKPNSASVVRSSLKSIPLVYQAIQIVYKFLFSKESPKTNQTISDGEIWQLKVWDPAKFSLYFFIPLNPINLLLVHDLGNSSFVFVSSSMLMVSLTLHFLIHDFLNLINDKQLLFSEMFAEYTNKFVKPKTNTLKKDVLIDATNGPYHSFVLTDVKPYSVNKQKSRLFVTHDLQGNQVKEYVARNSSIQNSKSSDHLYVDESSQLLSQLKSDNEMLSARNQQLYMQIARLSNQNSSMNSFIDDDERPSSVAGATFFSGNMSPSQIQLSRGTSVANISSTGLSHSRPQSISPNRHFQQYPFDSSQIFTPMQLPPVEKFDSPAHSISPKSPKSNWK